LPLFRRSEEPGALQAVGAMTRHEELYYSFGKAMEKLLLLSETSFVSCGKSYDKAIGALLAVVEALSSQEEPCQP
jgi:hypothetical protein